MIKCGYSDTIRTLVFTGRPMRVIKNEYIMDWEINRKQEMKEATAKGIIPYQLDVEKNPDPSPEDLKKMMNARPHLMGFFLYS